MLLDRQSNSTPGHQGQVSSESCCAHNLQKSTIYSLSWTGDARWGDKSEKRFVNSVMAQQRATGGMLLYDLILKQGSQKVSQHSPTRARISRHAVTQYLTILSLLSMSVSFYPRT